MRHNVVLAFDTFKEKGFSALKINEEHDHRPGSGTFADHRQNLILIDNLNLLAFTQPI